MAKLDAYKLVSQGGGNSASSPVAVSAIKSNIKAFAGIQYSLKGIQSTLTSMERIEIDLIENDKLREIADRRRAKRERDRLAEEAAENKNLGSPSKVKQGKLSKRDENKIGGLFGGLLGTLQKLGQAALNFLLQIGGFIAIKSTLEWVADPANQQALVTFFEKTSFVFNKIYGFTKWLVQDQILDGISKTFGKDSTFTDRVGGLWQIITGIAGMSLLLNPFGTIDAILSLLGLDFYREAADVIDDPDGPDRRKPTRTAPRTSGNAPRTDARGNQINRAGQQARLNDARSRTAPRVTTPVRPSRFAATMAKLEVGNRFQKALFRGGKALTNTFGAVNAAAIKGAVRNFGSRIPWIGGLLSAAFALLDGDPIDKALFRAAGTLVGGAIGTFFPIPGISTILGSIIGDYSGELIWMLFNPSSPEGGFEQVKRKIFEDASKALSSSKEAVKLIWGWLGPKISAAGGFIKERAKRFRESLPIIEIPEIQLPGFLGGGKFGGDEIVNPLFFTPLGTIAYVRALRQAFFENGPVTPVKMGIPDFFQKLQNIFNMLSSQSGQQIGGRSAQKQKERERTRQRSAERQDQAAQAAALRQARDAFLERNRIRQYDPNKGYSEMELVYKNEGFGFIGMGYKDYHVFRNGKLIHVRYYGNLHEKNFKSKEAWNAFQAGGGNAMLRGRANYDVKKVLELGFNATAQLKRTPPPATQTPQPQGGTPPVVKGAVGNDLKTRIRQLESGNNYATPFKAYLGGFGRAGEDLTKMTINQVVDWQKAYIRHQASKGIPESKRSAAVGAYQMLFPERAADYAGVSRNALFSPANQDKMVEYYLDMAGQKKWKAGSISNEAYNNGLAGQFASIKRADGKGVYDNDGINKAYGTVLDILSGAPRPAQSTTPVPAVQPQSSYTVGFKDYEGPGAPAPAKPGGSESTTPKSPVSSASPDTGFAILPYNSSESDSPLPYEQATSIAEGLVGKKYSAYDLGSIGGLKEGGLQEAIDAYKGGNSGLGSLSTLGDAIGLGERLGTGSDTTTTAYPKPGESGYAGPRSEINPLNYDRDAKLTDNTGKEYGFGDIFQEIFGSPQQILGGAVNPNTFGGTRGFDFRDLFPDNKGSNPYGPLGKLSAGGPIPNNLPKYFIGKIFKGIGKAVSGVFKGVSKVVSSVVSGVGNFLSSPLGSVLTTAVGFIPGFQWVPAVAAGFRGANALMQGDIMGAITNTVGALSGFFPETMNNFFGNVTNTFGEGLGGVVNGFLKGGIGGALQGLGGMLPQGIQKFFGQVGNFIQANPSVGAVICSLPGVANVPGLANLFGLGEFPGMPGPIGIARTVAGQMGMGGVFDAMAGMMGADPESAFGQMAGELGVSPAALGLTGSMGGGSFGQGSPSEEYAMQTRLEFIPIPMILLKLVPIDRPVPINNTQYVPVRQPAQQQK